MGKTITIDDDVYKLLSSLKEGAGDSFTKVLRRHVHKPDETAGELLDAHENAPPPKANASTFNRLLRGKGRRSPSVASGGNDMNDLAGDLLGSVAGLPSDLGSNKKKYLPALIRAKKYHRR